MNPNLLVPATSSILWCAALLAAVPAVASSPLRAVLLRGDAAPGGATVTSFGPPALNEAGHIVYTGRINQDPLNSDWGLIAVRGEGVESVAALGQQPPGFSSRVEFDSFPNQFFINESGKVAFSAYIDGRGIGTTSPVPNHLGVWSEGSNGLEDVVLSNDPAPTNPQGNVIAIPLVFGFGNGGGAVYRSPLYGVATEQPSGNGLWRDTGDDGQATIVETGMDAPGLGAGTIFGWTINHPRMNDREQVSFSAALFGTGVTLSNDQSVWGEDLSGQLELIAREGDPIPGFDDGTRFGETLRVAITSDGQRVIHGSLTGALWGFAHLRSTEAGTYEILLGRHKTPAGLPEGVHYYGPHREFVNRHGRIAVVGRVSGAGVTSANRDAIFSDGLSSGVTIIAREGDPAPGTPEGVVFKQIYEFDSHPSDAVINALGQVAFTAEVAGPDITTSNDYGLWAQDRDGALRLIAREGDQFDLSDDPLVPDVKTLSRFSFLGESGNDDGKPSGFNDLGQIAFEAWFTDGTGGIFISDLVATLAGDLAGDYNADGFVNLADYTVWRDTLGEVGTGLTADGDLDGTVDSDDYQVWKTNFGNSDLPEVAGQLVPEPSAHCLFVSLIALLGLQFRRTQQASLRRCPRAPVV
jgi:hypothetical protein